MTRHRETRRGPGFIGIGAQKAATTWLWANLRTHPQLWLPIVKELHWFDVKFGRSQYLHRSVLDRYRPALRAPTLRNVMWLIGFYRAMANGYSDDDYLNLMRCKAGRVSGEITPAYSILAKSDVDHIYRLVASDCKVLFCMRDPVSRTWSQIRMDCWKQRINVNELSGDQIYALAKKPSIMLRSDYARTIQNWSVFGQRLGSFFYEDLAEEPAKFLEEVFNFIGVDRSWRPPKLGKAVLVGGGGTTPPASLATRLTEEFAPMIKWIEERVGRVPDSWLRQCDVVPLFDVSLELD